MESLAKRFDQVAAAWRCVLEDVLFVRDLASKVVELVRSHPEICLGMAGRLDVRSPAIAHDFHVAVVAALVAQSMDLSLQQQLTIVRAALMMNLSSFELHDTLAYTNKSLTLAQRINIARHPLLAAELLSHSPGADLQWIEAVEQHHESMDGTGYPFGLAGKDICIEARVVKAADLWCALVSSRPTRLAKFPHHAMQELQFRERTRLDMQVLATMRRRLGNYPPGTLVRLASRETAVVTGFALGNASPRHVVAVFDVAGELIAWPKLRDTGKTAFVIRGYTNMPQYQKQTPDWEKVWALVRSSLVSVPLGARVA
ncbi:MAG: HD domain-containing phosphohydrolase [Sterolibacterium sp.]